LVTDIAEKKTFVMWHVTLVDFTFFFK